MQICEERIKDYYNSTTHIPSERLRSQIISDAIENNLEINKYRRKITAKTVIITAVLVVVLSTTALAAKENADVIRQWFSFGNSTATQIDRSIAWLRSDNVYSISRILTDDSPKPYAYETFTTTWYSTLEEASSVFPFDIKVPSFLPETVTGLLEDETLYAYLIGDESGFSFYYTYMEFGISLPPGDSYTKTESTFWLFQTYYGADVHFNFETVFNIEKHMVGDVEALLVRDGITHPFLAPSYKLIWVKDGVLYELRTGSHHVFSVDDLIAIAESIN